MRNNTLRVIDLNVCMMTMIALWNILGTIHNGISLVFEKTRRYLMNNLEEDERDLVQPPKHGCITKVRSWGSNCSQI